MNKYVRGVQVGLSRLGCKGAGAISILVAMNVTALVFMAPLNSLILAHPDKLVCLSCLFTIYGGGMLVVGLALAVAAWWVGEKIVVRVQVGLSVLALVSFLRLVWMTMVSPPWQTLFGVLCVVTLVPVMIWFVRAEKKTVLLVHQFFIILTLYELFSIGQVILQAQKLETAIESSHETEANVERETSVTLGEDVHHVFWIIFDEFSLLQSLQRTGGGGDFNVDIVPNLKKFSRTSTWYFHARTLYPLTDQAITALLSGLKDVSDTRKRYSSDFQQKYLLNFDAKNYLSDMARNMDVFIVGAYLPYCMAFRHVAEGCLDFVHGLANYRSLVRSVWDRTILGMVIAADDVSGFGTMITQKVDPQFPIFPITSAFRAGQSFDRPTFTYIHELLPHFPYQFTSNGAAKFANHFAGPSKKMDIVELEELQKSYKEQLAYLDFLFGKFIAELQARNLYDQSWIVVMSDHGTSFDPRNPGRVAGHEQVDRVPFLIKSPGQARGVVKPQRVYIHEFFEILLEQMAQGVHHPSSSRAELS